MKKIHLKEYKNILEIQQQIIRLSKIKKIDENLEYILSLINYILSDLIIDQYLTSNENLKMTKEQQYKILKQKYFSKKNGYQKEIEFINENIKIRFKI